MDKTRLSKKCLFLLFLAVFVIFLLEITVRLSGRADHLYTEPPFELSPRGDYWRFQPGFEGRVLGPTRVRIGPFGSRLHGTPHSRPAGKVIVAVFGDSITFGQGVEDHLTFAARIEERLLDANILAKILNFGVPGHTLEMEIAHLVDRLSEIHPVVVVWAFPSYDLNPERAQNRVDRFGYLTKNAFGPPSFWLDSFRAVLRKSHFTLLAKAAVLRIRASTRSSQVSASATKTSLESKLTRFRKAMARFEKLTVDVRRIVICLDMRETPLTRGIHDIMETEFPHLTYVHASPAFEQFPPSTLRIPRDGHPNATAHKIYAELLWQPLGLVRK